MHSSPPALGAQAAPRYGLKKGASSLLATFPRIYRGDSWRRRPLTCARFRRASDHGQSLLLVFNLAPEARAGRAPTFSPCSASSRLHGEYELRGEPRVRRASPLCEAWHLQGRRHQLSAASRRTFARHTREKQNSRQLPPIAVRRLTQSRVRFKPRRAEQWSRSSWVGAVSRRPFSTCPRVQRRLSHQLAAHFSATRRRRRAAPPLATLTRGSAGPTVDISSMGTLLPSCLPVPDSKARWRPSSSRARASSLSRSAPQRTWASRVPATFRHAPRPVGAETEQCGLIP
jgi:hypothetical protein